MGQIGTSRGDAISGYYPNFAGTSGVKIYADNLKGQVVSGSIANSGVVYAVAHNLGKVPKFVFFTAKGTVGQLKDSSTSANSVGLATVSAATTTNIYVAGAKNTTFNAFVLI